MKLRTLSAALMTAGLGFIMQPTFAQGISDDVIRIGIISRKNVWILIKR